VERRYSEARLLVQMANSVQRRPRRRSSQLQRFEDKLKRNEEERESEERKRIVEGERTHLEKSPPPGLLTRDSNQNGRQGQPPVSVAPPVLTPEHNLSYLLGCLYAQIWPSIDIRTIETRSINIKFLDFD
jgi:hypothetical protein